METKSFASHWEAGSWILSGLYVTMLRMGYIMKMCFSLFSLFWCIFSFAWYTGVNELVSGFLSNGIAPCTALDLMGLWEKVSSRVFYVAISGQSLSGWFFFFLPFFFFLHITYTHLPVYIFSFFYYSWFTKFCQCLLYSKVTFFFSPYPPSCSITSD